MGELLGFSFFTPPQCPLDISYSIANCPENTENSRSLKNLNSPQPLRVNNYLLDTNKKVEKDYKTTPSVLL